MDFNNLKYEQEKILDKIFDFVYGCALHDAVLQGAFIGKKAWIRGLEEPKKKLREYIEKVINKEFENQDNHDNFFIKRLILSASKSIKKDRIMLKMFLVSGMPKSLLIWLQNM